MTKFSEFINKIKIKSNPIKHTRYEGDFDEMIEYGYESKDGKVLRIKHETNNLHVFIYNEYQIALVPWNDGIMLIDIKVKDKNKGIGTRVMNELYDISELLNTPIYLIPYPSENFDANKEKEVISRVENWYKRLGFDIAVTSSQSFQPKVWCNME